MQDVARVISTVERAAAGDEAACARLVEEHHAPMVRTAYVISGDVELAREATQIAWTKAWRRLGSLRQRDQVRPWLVAIAANEARQLLRSRHRRVIYEIRSGPDRSAVDPTERLDVLDLRHAVSRLSMDDRSLLAMRYVAGLDSNEIGSYAGMSASGVRSRLARLLDRLRKELDDA